MSNVHQLRPSGQVNTPKDMAEWLRGWADHIEEHGCTKDLLLVQSSEDGVFVSVCGDRVTFATVIGLLEMAKVDMFRS